MLRIFNTSAAPLTPQFLGSATGSGAGFRGDAGGRARRDEATGGGTIHEIDRNFVAAWATGTTRGWSLEPWERDEPSSELASEAARECRAQARFNYVDSRRHGSSSRSPRDPRPGNSERSESRHNPWRACETLLAEGVASRLWPTGGSRLGTGGADGRSDGAAGTYLKMHDRASRDDFAVRVKHVPSGNIATLLNADRTPVTPPLLLQRNRDGWRSLGDLSARRNIDQGAPAGSAATSAAASGDVVDCSAYRAYAVVPEPESLEPTVMYAGSRLIFSGAGNFWYHTFVNSAGNALHLHHGDGPQRQLGAYTLSTILTYIPDDEVLQIGNDRFYVPMRDAVGRFWLAIGKTEDSAVRVADTRSTRCLDSAVFLRQRVSPDQWVQQPDVSTKTARCQANGKVIATGDVTLESLSPLRIGLERATGIMEFKLRATGAVRNAARTAIDAMCRKMRSASNASNDPARAAGALAPLLASLPQRLHVPVIARIRGAMTTFQFAALGFKADWEGLTLVDDIEGGANYCAQDGFIYLAPSIVDLSTDQLARFLLDVIVGKYRGQTDLFRRLGNTDDMLSRAGRFISYDPTLMQSAVTWPDRVHIARELNRIYTQPADKVHPMDTMTVPRRADLQSEDLTDNLSILLRDTASVLCLIDALSAAPAAEDPTLAEIANATCLPEVDSLLHSPSN